MKVNCWGLLSKDKERCNGQEEDITKVVGKMTKLAEKAYAYKMEHFMMDSSAIMK